MSSKFHNHSGFTVTELILVIGVFAIIAVIAGPNFKNQLSNQKLKATARNIYSALQQAKLEAVEENETVAVAFSPAAYSPNGNSAQYQLFLDDGAGGGTAGNLSKESGEALLATITMPKGISLISASFTDGSVTTDKVGFTGQGLPLGSYSGSVQVRTDSRWYRISLSVAGNVKTEISDDGINWS